MIKRSFDLVICLVLIMPLLILMLLISVAVKSTSKGPVLYWSSRVGREGTCFNMPKFRSMKLGTPAVATHLMKNPDKCMTSIGVFLRNSSLDELPQLFSVLRGEMSFVGPRPALYNQSDLIMLRKKKNVDRLLPGITGWAQVNGRDKLSIPDKVALDVEYLNQQSFWMDIKILWITLFKIIKRTGVSH
jgi:O-antigen biosynthesis protein WbqP